MGTFLLWATWVHEDMAIFVKIDRGLTAMPMRLGGVALKIHARPTDGSATSRRLYNEDLLLLGLPAK